MEKDLPYTEEELEAINKALLRHLVETGETLVYHTAEYEGEKVGLGERNFGWPPEEEWYDGMYSGAAACDELAGRSMKSWRRNA